MCGKISNKFELPRATCYCVFVRIRTLVLTARKACVHVHTIVAGIVWFALAALMVLALACAAKRPLPELSPAPCAETQVSVAPSSDKEREDAVEREVGAALLKDQVQGARLLS